MTHYFRSICLVVLFVTSLPSLSPGQSVAPDRRVASATTAAPSGTPAGSRVGLRQESSFWDDSLKTIKEGGSDIGSWLAYRRQLLVEASLTNRYFWFCITSFFANVVLMYLFYASRVSEDRKLWKATAAMTELWNWALYADWTARNAVHKFNTHIEQCGRAHDDGVSAERRQRENREEAERVRAECDALQKERGALQEQLADRDEIVASLTARIDEIAKTLPGGADSKLTAQLMEKVNLLTAQGQQLEQQLRTAQEKLKAAGRAI